MQAIYRRRTPLCCLLVAAMVILSLPRQAPAATMVTTEAALEDVAASGSDRGRVRAFLRRQDLRRQLEAQDVEVAEALARVESLSDSEVARLAGRIEDLPAGSGEATAFIVQVVAELIANVVGQLVVAIIEALVEAIGSDSGPGDGTESVADDDFEQERLQPMDR